MGTIAASTLLSSASTVLQDVGHTRWPLDELLGWLNMAQREIVLQRPDAQARNVSLTLDAGARQQIPADAVRLIDVVRNVGGRAVSLAVREMLDAEDPNWYAGTPQAAIVHYAFDQHDPRTFYVYPPATGGGQVEIVVSAAPPEVRSVSDAITVDDVYANAILDYVLFRALSKDAGASANMSRATAHYQAFQVSLSGKATQDKYTNPNLNTAPPLKTPVEVLV